MLLSEYDIQYVNQKDTKDSALTDYMAYQPVENYQPMQPEFLDEEILSLFKENDDDDDDT